MNDISHPLDLSSLSDLPDLSQAEASQTELGWTYSYNDQFMLQSKLRSSTFEGKARYDLEDIINDFNAMDRDTYVSLLTKLYDNQMDPVSHMSNMQATEINRYLKKKVNNDI